MGTFDQITDSDKIKMTFEKEFSASYKELGIKNVDYFEDGIGFNYNGKYVRMVLILHDPQQTVSITVKRYNGRS